MNDNKCFAPDEPHKKEYVDRILKSLEEKHGEVGMFNSAIELDGWDSNGYEFLYDFAKAVIEASKGKAELIPTPPLERMQDDAKN